MCAKRKTIIYKHFVLSVDALSFYTVLLKPTTVMRAENSSQKMMAMFFTVLNGKNVKSKITKIIEEFKANHSLVGQKHFEGVPISLFITQPNISPLLHRLNAWQIYSSHMNQEILKIIYFSKSILSLDQMAIQDQVALTKKSIFKMYLLHLVPVISSKGLVLGTGRIIDSKSLELLFGDQLAKKILEFSEDVKNLSFNKENLVHVLAFILIPKSQELKNRISGTIGDLIYIQTKLEYLDRIFRGSVLPWLRENQKWMKLPEIFREIFEITVENKPEVSDGPINL
ncbi:unnamed protein product [Caenorhabditis nigoni]